MLTRCTILPVAAALDLPPGLFLQSCDIFTAAAMSSQLLALQLALPIWVDDLNWRRSCADKGSASLWTQPVLQYLVEKGSLTHEQYYAAEDALARAGYSPTRLNSDLFRWRVRQQGYRITAPILETLQLLSARHCSFPAALAFASELLIGLVMDQAPVFVRDLLTDALIGALQSGRSSGLVLSSLQNELSKRLPANSQHLRTLLARVRAWEQGSGARI